MPIPDTSIGGSRQDFPSTLWGLVSQAGNQNDPARQKHLATLISRYWKPAYFYIRAMRRKGVEDAKDLTQEFFARLLEKDYLHRLSPDRGSFRGFLKRSIKNFVRDAGRREAVRRPIGEAHLIPFEDCGELGKELSADADPDQLFEQEWNREVLWASIQELEAKMKEEGLDRCFATFRAYCFPNGPEDDVPDTRHMWEESESKGVTYREIAQQMSVSETAVRKRVAHCIRELRVIASRRINEYVSDPRDVDSELKEIVQG